MLRRRRRYVRAGSIEDNRELLPDEILLDKRNIPQFDQSQMEGKIEKRISRQKLNALGGFFLLLGLVFTFRVWSLQVVNGEEYAEKSENNRLRHSLVFADRGLIYDREGDLLVWNEPRIDQNGKPTFPSRKYINKEGFAHVLGYVSYPKKDSKGFFYEEEIVGKSGIESFMNDSLKGETGLKLTETDALGNVIGESELHPPVPGESLKLSIEDEIQAKLYELIKNLATDRGFEGGSAVIMDVHNGEILALTSYPEYSPNIMTEAEDVGTIRGYFNDKRTPFIDRVIDGVYTPGSIMKQFMAIAALEENIISPEKEIVSTGSLVVPNPYNPSKPTVFGDWKAHGATDMRRAIAVSSDVYFYVVGGGFGNQKGLGITKIEQYMRMFGYGESLDGFFKGKAGVIPNPRWKEENFPGDPWRVGDTYVTSIGQYGYLVSPIQAVRANAAIANGGYMIEPSIFVQERTVMGEKLPVSDRSLQIAREGMRDAVINKGTASGLNISSVAIASKTGTAELGVSKARVNSWNVGFFPYDKPRYAYAIMMEKGDRHNTVGALFVMRQLFDWMAIHKSEYLK